MAVFSEPKDVRDPEMMNPFTLLGVNGICDCDCEISRPLWGNAAYLFISVKPLVYNNEFASNKYI